MNDVLDGLKSCQTVRDENYKIFNEKFRQINEKLDTERTVTVLNGERKTMTKTECLQDLWQKQYKMQTDLDTLMDRTSVLDDLKKIFTGVNAVLKYIKPIGKGFLVLGIITTLFYLIVSGNVAGVIYVIYKLF